MVKIRDIGINLDSIRDWGKLQLSDNFGTLDQGFDLESDRWAFGEADIHLPPGWGSIPFLDVFARWTDYEGDLILEIKPGFMDCAGEGLQTMCRLLGTILHKT
jgi:sugar phosphate isomerase/epimerase